LWGHDSTSRVHFHRHRDTPTLNISAHSLHQLGLLTRSTAVGGGLVALCLCIVLLLFLNVLGVWYPVDGLQQLVASGGQGVALQLVLHHLARPDAVDDLARADGVEGVPRRFLGCFRPWLRAVLVLEAKGDHLLEAVQVGVRLGDALALTVGREGNDDVQHAPASSHTAAWGRAC